MKKLMFVAAAALCGAAFADSVQSANVVGYENLDLAKQKELRGISFFAVSGSGVDIQSIIPYDGDDVSDDQFKTWWWNPNKDSKNNIIGNEYAVRRSYYYDPDDPAAEEGYVDLDPDGESPELWVWTTMDDDEPIKWEKTFTAGTGFFTQPGCTDPKLMVSGQVLQPVGNDAYYKLELGKQKQLVADPFPVSVALQSIVPFDGEDVSDDDFRTWWWNPNKDSSNNIIGNEYAVRRSYYYDPTDPAAEEGYVDLDPDGESPELWVWTTMDDDEPIKWEKTFASGEGFFTQPGCAEPKLAFPNPFYVAE